MNRRVGYGLAVVASALTVYYAIPPLYGHHQFGRDLPLLTVGNHALCAKSSGADELDFVASPESAGAGHSGTLHGTGHPLCGQNRGEGRGLLHANSRPQHVG